MTWLLLLSLYITTLIMLGLAAYGFHCQGSASCARPFTGFCVASALYAFFYSLELSSSSLSEAVFWTNFLYIGSAFLPALGLMFIIRFTRQDRYLSRAGLVLLWGVPTISLLAKWTDRLHGWFYQDVAIYETSPVMIIHGTGGPIYGMHLVYQNLVLIIGLGLILRFIIRSNTYSRAQGALVLLGLFCAWLGHMAYQTGLLPLRLDYAPFGMMGTGLLWALGVFKFGLLRIEPIAHAKVFDSMRDAVVVIGGQNRVLMGNPEAQRLFGHTDNFFPGMSSDDYFQAYPDVRAFANGTQEEAEINLWRFGKDTLLLAHKMPLSRSRSDLPGYVFTFSDITSRMQAEKIRRESEISYRDVMNSVPDAIYIQDREGRFLDINEGAAKMYGYDREEFLGRTPEFLTVPGRNDLPAVAKKLERAFAGEAQTFEFYGRRKDGSIFPKEVRLFPATYFSREAVIAIARDITDQRAMEAQLVQGQKMEAIGRLAGGVAHDFNNMLQAITGYTDLAMDRASGDETMAECLNMIKESADRSVVLTRQLLSFARKQVIEPRALDLNKALPDTINWVQRLIGEGVEVVWRPGMDAAWVKCDQVQLDQIITNLAVNARDAMEGVGRFVIDTSEINYTPDQAARRKGVTPGAYVCVRFSDSGPGIPQDVLEHIFEPFYTTKKMGKGTGMGLATVYGIIQQHGGHIDATSELGQGTVVSLYFPRIPAPVTEPVKASPAPQATPSVSGLSILLVDDEPSILKFGSRLLEKEGHVVFTADRPDKAVELFAQDPSKVDLLITDIMMPGMNGNELADRLKELKPALRVIWMSGYPADAMSRQGLLRPGTIFLQKPFSRAALQSKLQEVLAS